VLGWASLEAEAALGRADRASLDRLVDVPGESREAARCEPGIVEEGEPDVVAAWPEEGPRGAAEAEEAAEAMVTAMRTGRTKNAGPIRVRIGPSLRCGMLTLRFRSVGWNAPC